ncbi:NAD(P)/FAD-dependent oxidoreductase [Chelatococcus reniformis]|uniref:FAD-dependent oxidoreductase n=1 Tax=Chelatococcus reniformis TaxID=1494448 RepID=A0A916TX75_9HYPH|nr:FAD-dependent oxidoreductase [Chelatococcus reniformis]GGC46111.1 FAD-dependent oxidoreductase [Chelatococcus reniformis]
MSSSAASFERSLWSATAAEPPLGAEASRLAAAVDVAVVGGGITGCSAALAAARAGASVALFEARQIGWGASGRNGGQVIPGLKYDPSELRGLFGEASGAALAEAAGGAADLVFELIARHAIQCTPQRGGWLQAAPSPTALARVQARAREWIALGAPVELLDADGVARLVGTRAYVGGWIDRRAGVVNPLAYVRGLARAAREHGAAIYQDTPVSGIRRGSDGWQVTTAAGSVTAKSLVVGTDGYTDGLVPGLAQTVLAVQSALIATEPLPAELQQTIMPGGVCCSETRRLAFYFRQSADGRLVFGGRGAVGDAEQPLFADALIAAMQRTFPQTRGAAITHRWSGQVALTLDGIPHLHEPQPGLLIGLGYNGRGVAMASLMGRWLAGMALRGERPPLPSTPISPIAWHGLRRPAIALGVGWAWLRDRMGLAA